MSATESQTSRRNECRKFYTLWEKKVSKNWTDQEKASSAPLRYRNLNKEVKAKVKQIKQVNLENKVTGLEEDSKANNSKNLFKTVRELEGRPRKSLKMVKDKQGQKHNQPDEVMLCWEEHFRYTFPHDTDAVLDIPDSPADTQNEDPQQQMR